MTKSKAIYYENIGEAQDVLRVGDFSISEPSDNEVQVAIAYSGINPSDVKMRAGARGKLAFDKIIPHSDASGIIISCGKYASKFKIGDRVWIYNAAWNRMHGTAANLCNLQEELLVKLPDNVSLETGACLGIPALTASSALLSLNCQKGSNIMITGGAGSVSLFAIQLAKFLGYKVFTTVSTTQKGEIARSAGADYVINCKTENILERIKEYTNNELLDGIVEAHFGSNLNWSVDSLKTDTIIATYGSSSEPNPVLPFYPMMFKQITIKPIFVYILQPQLRQASINLVQNALKVGALKPYIHKIYSFDDVINAHLDVEFGTKIGQVLLKV